MLFAQREWQHAAASRIKPATPVSPKAAFLEAARLRGADYYVTGYLTPLGDEVSLLIQVVSTYSGTVVWSTTTQVRTYAEAAGQSDIIRDAILRHAGRSLAALEATAAGTHLDPCPADERAQRSEPLPDILALKADRRARAGRAEGHVGLARQRLGHGRSRAVHHPRPPRGLGGNRRPDRREKLGPRTGTSAARVRSPWRSRAASAPSK